MFAQIAQDLFSETLSRYTESVLRKVCEDYNLDFSELSEKYLSDPSTLSFFTEPKKSVTPSEKKVARKRKEVAPKEPKKICTGLTSKGTPCTFAAAEGHELCGIHLRKLEGGSKTEKLPNEPKEPKAPKKEKKKPKGVPAHNHTLEEENTDDCDLCSTHGNVVQPLLTEKEFEAVTADGEDIRSKLKALIAEQDDESELEPVKPEVEPEVAPEPEPEESEEDKAQKAAFERAKTVMAAKKAADEKPKTSGFIRPPQRRRVKPEDVAGPSETRFKKVLTWAEECEEAEMLAQKFDEFGEEDVQRRLAQALVDSDASDGEEVDMDQMCDSPHSQFKLQQAFVELNMEEEE